MRLTKISASAALLLALGSVGVFAVDNAAAPADTKAAPATQPVDARVQTLIDQLADADAAVREDAMKKLADLGRSALPALKESANSENPEVRSRSRRLVRMAERRLPPAAPQVDGNSHSRSVSVSITDGEKTTDVNDNGYRIKIRQSPAGITMDVTGVEGGKEVTETYKAIDADELKRDNPEAFALYEQYNQGGRGGVMVFGNGGGGRIQIGVNGNAINGQPGVIRVAPPATQPAPGNLPPAIDIQGDIRIQVEQQLNQADIPEEHRQRIREMLDRARQHAEDVHERAVREQQRQNNPPEEPKQEK